MQLSVYSILFVDPNIFSCNESNTNYTSSDGVLTSPNWPSNYEDFTHCIYMLSVGSDSGSKIILNITEYDIEGHSSCTYDYLEVDLKIKQIYIRCASMSTLSSN